MNKNFRTKVALLHGWLIRTAAILGLAAGIGGCSLTAPSTQVPSQLAAVVGCDASKVTITGVHSFKDSHGAWRVVGMINNDSSRAVSKVVTGVETRTKTNQPVDQGEDVSAYPLDLQPGEKAPFTAWIDREIPGLDHFEVEVDECVLTEPAERSQVDVRGGRLAVDDNGAAEVSAELYNPGSKSVLVNGLMAAVYDGKGALIAADYVNVATRYLAPGESGPVRATLDLPPGGATQVKSYKLFMDVLVADPGAQPVDVQHDVQVLGHYVDSSGHFHLIGQITNPGTKDLMTSLQATVYTDSTKSTVVDAAQYDTWLPLEPGETLPFDITNWGALNHTAGLWDQLAAQDPAIELRLEPFLTWTENATVAMLPLVNDNLSIEGQQAIFTGEVKNDMQGSLVNGLVTAVARQKSDGEIVATGSTQLTLDDPAAPGQILDYDLVLPLPAGVDPSSVETEVTAMGQQP